MDASFFAGGLVTLILVAFVTFLVGWYQPQPQQVVIQLPPPQDQTNGCIMSLGTLILVVLIGIILFLLAPELGLTLVFARP